MKRCTFLLLIVLVALGSAGVAHAHYNTQILQNAETGEYIVIATAGQNELAIAGVTRVEDVTSIAFVTDKRNGVLSSDILVAEADGFRAATVRLAKHAPTHAIVKCDSFDVRTDTCDAWEETSIPFTETERHIEFIVDEFSAYAGVAMAEPVIDRQPAYVRIASGDNPSLDAITITATSSANTTLDNLSATPENPQNYTTIIYNWNVSNESISLLHLAFDTQYEGTASGAVRDYSGRGNNATLGGGTASRVPEWIADGARGGGYRFDGSDYVLVPGMSYPENFSVSFWFRRENPGGSSLVFLYSHGNFDAESSINIAYHETENTPHYGGNIVVCVRATGDESCAIGSYGKSNALFIKPGYMDGSWHHLVLVANKDAGIRVYIDGILVGEDLIRGKSSMSPSGNVHLAARNTVAQFWTGDLDEVFVYNRSLSQAQIRQLAKTPVVEDSFMSMFETRTHEMWTLEATPNNATADGTTVVSEPLIIQNTSAALLVSNSAPQPLEIVELYATPETENCSFSVERPDGFIDTFVGVVTNDICRAEYRPTFLSGTYTVSAELSNSSEVEGSFSVLKAGNQLEVSTVWTNQSSFFPGTTHTVSWNITAGGTGVPRMSTKVLDYEPWARSLPAYITTGATRILRNVHSVADDGSITYSVRVSFEGMYFAQWSGSEVNISIMGAAPGLPVPKGVILSNGTTDASLTNELINNSGEYLFRTYVTTDSQSRRDTYLYVTIPPNLSSTDVMIRIDGLRYKYSTAYTKWIGVAGMYLPSHLFLGGNTGDTLYTTGDEWPYLGRLPLYLPLYPGNTDGILLTRSAPVTVNPSRYLSLMNGTYNASFTWNDQILNNVTLWVYADKWGHNSSFSPNMSYTLSNPYAGVSANITSLEANTSTFTQNDQISFALQVNDSQGGPMTGGVSWRGDADIDAVGKQIGMSAIIEVRRTIQEVQEDGTIVARVYVEMEGDWPQQLYAGSRAIITALGRDGISPVPADIQVSYGNSNPARGTTTFTNNSGVYSLSCLSIVDINSPKWASYLEFSVPSNRSLNDVVIRLDYFDLMYVAPGESGVRVYTPEGYVTMEQAPKTFPVRSEDIGRVVFRTGDLIGTLGTMPVYFSLAPKDFDVFKALSVPAFVNPENRLIHIADGSYSTNVTWQNPVASNLTSYFFYQPRFGYTLGDVKNITLTFEEPTDVELNITDIAYTPTYFPGDTMSVNWTVLMDDAPTTDIPYSAEDYNYRVYYGEHARSSFEIRRSIEMIYPNGTVHVRLTLETEQGGWNNYLYSGSYAHLRLVGADGVGGIPEGVRIVEDGSSTASAVFSTSLINSSGVYGWNVTTTAHNENNVRSVWLDIYLPEGVFASDIYVIVDRLRFRISNNDFNLMVKNGIVSRETLLAGQSMIPVTTMELDEGADLGELGSLPLYMPLVPRDGVSTLILQPKVRIPSRYISNTQNYSSAFTWVDTVNTTLNASIYVDHELVQSGVLEHMTMSLADSRDAWFGAIASNTSWHAPGTTAQFSFQMNDSDGFISGARLRDHNPDAYGSEWPSSQSVEFRREIMNVTENGSITARLYIEFDVQNYWISEMRPISRGSVYVYGRDGLSAVPNEISVSYGMVNDGGILSQSFKNNSGVYFFQTNLTGAFYGAARAGYLEFVIPPNRSLSDIVIQIEEAIIVTWDQSSNQRIYIGNNYAEESDSPHPVTTVMVFREGDSFPGLGEFPVYLSMNPGDAGTYIDVRGSTVFESPADTLIEEGSSLYTAEHTFVSDTIEDVNVSFCTSKWGYSDYGRVCSDPVVLSRSVPLIMSVADNTSELSPASNGTTVLFTVNWSLVEEPEALGRVFVCNSSIISSAGCADRMFCASAFSDNRSHSCTHVVNESDTLENAYWAIVCTDYGACSAVSGAHTFFTTNNHSEWLIASVVTVPENPYFTGRSGSTFVIRAEVVDRGNGITSVNFTLTSPNGTDVIHNVNGTMDGLWWNSSSYTLDRHGHWNYSVVASDRLGWADSVTGAIRFPNITLSSPVSDSGNTNGSLTFLYSAIDGAGIKNCSLFVNEVGVQVDSVSPFGTFNQEGVGAGRYAWYVMCYDNSSQNKQGFSPVQRVSVIKATSYDVKDLSSDNVSMVSGFFLNHSFGMIAWETVLNLSAGADLDAHVSVGSGSISLNSTALPAFDSAANITLRSLSYRFSPEILKDNLLCGASCQNRMYDGENLSFTVSSFSNYSATANAQLVIFDDSDDGRVLNGSVIHFFANYSNVSTGNPVSGAEVYCAFSENSSGWSVPVNMTYNSTSALYAYYASFPVAGVYTFSVTCNGTPEGYEPIMLTDTFTISAAELLWRGNYSDTSFPGTYTVRLRTFADWFYGFAQEDTRNFSILATVPAIWFETPPTPVNDSLVTDLDLVVNVSTSHDKNHSVLLDWNYSLVGWWSFEEVLLNGTVVDNSSYGRDALLRSSDTNLTVAGIRGRALEFDNVSFVDTRHAYSWSADDPFTIELWFRTENVSRNATIIGKDGALEYALRIAQENLSFIYWNSSGGVSLSLATDGVVADNWYHVAVVYNGSSGSLFLDGVVVDADVAASSFASSENVSLLARGYHESGVLLGLYGMVDEVRFWDRAFSSTEVRAAYRAESYRLNRSFSSLALGVFDFTAYVIDTLGRVNQTESRSVRYNPSPSLSNVTLNATDHPVNSSLANLTAYLGAVVDPHGEPVTLVYDWRVDGESIAVLRLPFDTNISTNDSGAVRDYSSHAHVVTLGGGLPSRMPTWNATGISGGAYSFSTSAISVADSGSSSPLDFGAGNEISLSVWLNPGTQTAAAPQIIQKGLTGDSRLTFQLELDWPNVQFSYRDTTDTTRHVYATTTDVLAEDVWTHVVFTYTYGDNASAQFYVNGSAVAGDWVLGTGLSAPYVSDYPVVLGADPDLVSNPYIGLLDEVAVYRRMLSPSQIAVMYNTGVPRQNLTVSDETLGGDVWRVCVTPNDATSDGDTVCSNAVAIENSAPPVPVLLLPLDEDFNVFSRYPFFNWTVSVDPDGHSVNYTVNITAPVVCAPVLQRVVDVNAYTSVDRLCVDEEYVWTVRACDAYGLCSDWAEPFRFIINSTLSINLTQRSVVFGVLMPSSPGAFVSRSTLLGSPGPLVVENIGNVDVDVDVQALDALFVNAGLGTHYFQFADEDALLWKNFSSSYVRYTDGLVVGASRELELNVTVPLFEPPGNKSSTVQLQAVSAE